MRAVWSVILALILALSTGCATLERAGVLYSGATHPAVVKIECEGARGRGAAIGPREVLTVSHVVGANEEVWVQVSALGLTKARVVRRIPARPEPLVVLELEPAGGVFAQLVGFAEFPRERRFVPSQSGDPVLVLAQRGPTPWTYDALQKGDSGSPVLDDAGRLVGLVHGRLQGAPIAVYLPADALASLSGPRVQP